jgi:hypothetical protein
MTRNLMSSKQQRSASVVDDGVMEQALVEFRQSVHNWSEAAYNRPREVRVAVRRSWRLAVGAGGGEPERRDLRASSPPG